MTNDFYEPSLNPEVQRVKDDKKAMSACFSRCGWGLLILIATTFAASTMLSVGIIVIEVLKNAGFLSIDIMPFYEKYLLYINEVLVALAIALGSLLLLKMPKQAPEKQQMMPKHFIIMLCVSFAIAAVGSFIGNMWVTFWGLPFGGAGEDALTSMLLSMDPLQMVICTGIIAPIIEELFFRKLLIDRMYKYGETITIFTTALLFGLFHQNAGQFFYTFGFGLVLGYLYCRTGSYVHVTVLHMVFNCLLGIIPALVSPELLPLAESAEAYTSLEEIAAALPEIWGAYSVPLTIFGVYLLCRGALEISGLILAVSGFKKLNLKKREPALSSADQLYAAFANPGMITVCSVLCVMLIISLIPV